MTISYSEFYTRLRGAMTYDDLNYPRLKISSWLWDHFSFGDLGAHFINTGDPKPWQPDPNYHEPESRTIQ